MKTSWLPVVVPAILSQLAHATGTSTPLGVPPKIVNTAGLVENASFEEGQGGPTAWKLEGGQGRWMEPGRTGRRCVSVTGTGETGTSGSWQCDGLKLKPRTAYRFSAFIKSVPPSPGGCVITGPATNNRDFSGSQDWALRSFVLVTPDSTDAVPLRCGQWEVPGTVFFDDVSLYPVVPLYAQSGAITLCAGERIEGGRYIAEPDFNGEGSNEFRGLISHTAGFNSMRWVFGPGSTVVYKHAIEGISQMGGKVSVNVGYYQSGSLLIEASRDGRNWTEIGRQDKQGSGEMALPASLFPSPAVWVRMRGSGGPEVKGDSSPGSLQLYQYRYEGALQSEVPDAVGKTSYIEIVREDPSLRVTLDKIAGADSGNPLVAGRITATGSVREANVRLTLVREGHTESALSHKVNLEPGKSAGFTLPFDTSTAGTYQVILAIGGPEDSPAFIARTTTSVPALHASDYGYLIDRSARGETWWCEGTYKISRSRPAPRMKSEQIHLTAARNEYEPFQLVLRPASDLKDVSITVSDLVGPQGRIGQHLVDVNRVEWVRVENPTDAVGCRGDWPDPLPPCDALFDVKAGTNQPIWITLHAPQDAKPGTYEGTVTITAENQQPWRVPLSLRVLDFALPKEAHVFATFGFDIDPIRKYHNIKTDEDLRQVYELYMKNFAAHRIGPYLPMALDPMQVKFKSNLAWVGGSRVQDEKAMGAQSLKIVDDRDGASVDAHVSDLIPIDPQAGYTLQWKTKTAKPDQQYLVTVQNYDENRQWMSGRNIDLNAKGTGQWAGQERDLTGRFPKESRFVTIVLRPAMWSEKGEQVGTAWFDDVSLKKAPDGPELVHDGGFEVTASPVDVAVDFTAFDTSARHYLDEMGFRKFSLPVMGMGSGTFHSRHKGEIAGYTQGTPEYNQIMKSYLGQVEQHLAANGWLSKAYVYWFDEPEPKDFDFVKEGMAILKRSGPGLTRMLTEEPSPPLVGSVDLWCPLTTSFDAKVCRERQAAGDHVMWYVCCGPREPYATLFIDHPAIDLRMWLWQTYQHDVEGILIWATNYWTSPCAYPEPNYQNPYQDPMSYVSGYDTPVGTKRFWGNGDGRFIYPPNRKGNQDKQTKFMTGPVNSIRWEMLREGIEDFEYLWQLRQTVRSLKKQGVRGPVIEEAEKLTVVPEEICKSLTEFTWDPKPLHGHRRKVGLMLERLLKEYKLQIAE